jgi:hypothetical protein
VFEIVSILIDTTPSKVGYMAKIKSKKGDSYLVFKSRNRLEENFIKFKIGDLVIITVEWLHLRAESNYMVKNVIPKLIKLHPFCSPNETIHS